MRLIYVGWMVLAFPIGWTVSQVMLALMFFGLFTPIGLVFRLIGRDPLQRTRPARTGIVLGTQAGTRRPEALFQAILIEPLGSIPDRDNDDERDDPQDTERFEKAAADSQGESLAGEFWAFLAQNKKWWLLPIVIVMLLLGTLILLSGTAAAPFIYTLF